MTCTVQRDSSQQNGNNLTKQVNEKCTEGVCTINRVKHSMTVDGLIKGTPISFLVDSGVSCTLLSEEKFKAITQENSHNLKKSSGRILRQANGTPISTTGKLEMEIQMGPVVVQQEVIVSKIPEEGILGCDFLANHGCMIDMGKCEFHLNGKKLQCAATNQSKTVAVKNYQKHEESKQKTKTSQPQMELEEERASPKLENKEVSIENLAKSDRESPGSGEMKTNLKVVTTNEQKSNKDYKDSKTQSKGNTQSSREDRSFCVDQKKSLTPDTFIRQYRRFLIGRKFLVRTNHSPS